MNLDITPEPGCVGLCWMQLEATALMLEREDTMLSFRVSAKLYVLTVEISCMPKSCLSRERGEKLGEEKIDQHQCITQIIST